MGFAVGSLVKARGREWVVLPDSTDDLLVLRPLGGADDEVAGIATALENVESASFSPPSADDLGDFRSCRLLRDAVRLGFRASAGPFRSFGRLAFEPRPYQLVPLLLALKQDPVRILIADDVGIGKTIEALLIAKELLERGDARRLAVICPPPLAEQWQGKEMGPKFHLDAELLLPSTAARLEARLGHHESVFAAFDRLVVSMDFIKSDRRRDEFVRNCPDLVIVDEAHTCAFADDKNKGRHQRHQLLKQLAADPNRHLILVTATPHSGKNEEFRSLLALLDPDLAKLPDDLSGAQNEPMRRRLARHFVQRRRGDIRHFLQEDTPFPAREESEATWRLTPPMRALFDRVLAFARETVLDAEGDRRRQRVRFWSMLALLRSLASSPAAAAATLRERASTLDAKDADDADAIGRENVLDQAPDDAPSGVDLVPGSDADETEGDTAVRRRLRELANAAQALVGDADAKSKRAIELIKALVKDGHDPIVFCRFIPTAESFATSLREALPKGVAVEAVTGLLSPEQRESRIEELMKHERRVLVCTDCLSEGVNLQHGFDAVFHYDLSWNPTRHEQREGRVDRYGQPKKIVRVVTFYGVDNLIDGAVLDVLLKKHVKIRSALGVSVPVPTDTDQVAEAILNSLLLKGSTTAAQQGVLFPVDEKAELHRRWEADAEREKRSRTMFAQESLKPDEVAAELKAAREAIGSGVDVREFLADALETCGAVVDRRAGAAPRVKLQPEVPRALREALAAAGLDAEFLADFSRTDPAVEAVATYTMDASLDASGDATRTSPARRTGAIITDAVAIRTSALLVRFRFQIVTTRGDRESTPLLAEDCRLLAFRGVPGQSGAPQWLDRAASEALLAARPVRNLAADLARSHVQRVLAGIESLRPALDDAARALGDELLSAHRRVREASRARASFRVEPKLPPDVLGVFVYLPAAGVA